MSKNNVNIMVFEQQSIMTDQSRLNYSNTRKQPAFDGYSSSQPQAVIQTELNQLNLKISQLQQKAQKIQQLIRTSACNPSLSEINNTTINANPINSMHIEELLRVVQHKIQIVVQETKKILDKMSGQFEKKLSKALLQKNHEVNSIAKIQAHCRDTIVKVQQNYQEQINLVRNQHVHLEKRLLQRVQYIEGEYKRKMRDFQNKEQEYIATIQHLQNKLRMSSRSSKKMIEVTQQRPPTASIKTIKTETVENMSNLSSQNIGSSNALPAHDTSKRRTKIFEGKGSNRSISPNNQVLSPLKSQNNVKLQTQSVKHPVQQFTKQNKQSSTVVPISNNYMSQGAPINYHIKATVIQPEQPSIHTNKNIEIPKLAKEPEKSRKNELESVQKMPSQKQFLKDAPKPHWQRFQDFNDQQSSGSQEDVFFYPEHHTKDEPKSVFDYQNNSSMHSPFDLN